MGCSEEDLEKFLKRISFKKCWQWKAGKTSRGYGAFYLKKQKQILSHRFSFIIFKKEIPKNLEIDHLCRNRLCCNPNHLESVTRKENLSRSFLCLSTLNSLKTHCPSGHKYSKDNTILRINKNSRECKKCTLIRSKLFYKKQIKKDPTFRIRKNKLSMKSYYKNRMKILKNMKIKYHLKTGGII